MWLTDSDPETGQTPTFRGPVEDEDLSLGPAVRARIPRSPVFPPPLAANPEGGVLVWPDTILWTDEDLTPEQRRRRSRARDCLLKLHAECVKFRTDLLADLETFFAGLGIPL